MTSKKSLSERDICTKFILPAIVNAGWDLDRQIREEVFFTDGRIFVKGQETRRGERKRADFILYQKPNIPVAVIEAKDNNHSIRSGIQQALDYAQILDIPVAISSNGDGFLVHDRSGSSAKTESTIHLDAFPSPAALWDIYKKYKGISGPQQETIAGHAYHFDGSGRAPRYYQQIAVNRTVEAIAKGQPRGSRGTLLKRLMAKANEKVPTEALNLTAGNLADIQVHYEYLAKYESIMRELDNRRGGEVPGV